MSTLLKGILCLPPTTTNHSYGLRNRRMYKSAEMGAYQASCRILLYSCEQDSRRIAALRVSTRKTPLAVCMRFHVPTLWRRDLDGMVKLPLDAIFAYLQVNDNRVTRLLLEKRLAPPSVACLEVEVMEEDEEKVAP